MQSKKAQGISINTIVIVIIAVLVLALILVFATGSFEKLTGRLRQSEDATGDMNLVSIQAQCSQACLQAKNIGIDSQWKTTTYCNKNFTIDDKEKVRCWKEPINTWCEVTTKNDNGEGMKCTPGDGSECSDCVKV